jgi:hypothetical protein
MASQNAIIATYTITYDTGFSASISLEAVDTDQPGGDTTFAPKEVIKLRLYTDKTIIFDASKGTLIPGKSDGVFTIDEEKVENIADEILFFTGEATSNLNKAVFDNSFAYDDFDITYVDELGKSTENVAGVFKATDNVVSFTPTTSITGKCFGYVNVTYKTHYKVCTFTGNKSDAVADVVWITWIKK